MSAYALPPLDGVLPRNFWLVAREASVSIATVMAIAGGHRETRWDALPVDRVHRAAGRIGCLIAQLAVTGDAP